MRAGPALVHQPAFKRCGQRSISQLSHSDSNDVSVGRGQARMIQPATEGGCQVSAGPASHRGGRLGAQVSATGSMLRPACEGPGEQSGAHAADSRGADAAAPLAAAGPCCPGMQQAANGPPAQSLRESRCSLIKTPQGSFQWFLGDSQEPFLQPRDQQGEEMERAWVRDCVRAAACLASPPWLQLACGGGRPCGLPCETRQTMLHEAGYS